MTEGKHSCPQYCHCSEFSRLLREDHEVPEHADPEP